MTIRTAPSPSVIPLDTPAGRDVRAAVARIVDPCSDAMGFPLDLAEMGLIASATTDEAAGRVDIVLRLTSACCAYGPAMAARLAQEIEALGWTREVTVRIDHRELWTPAMMEAGAAEGLEVRRARTRELTGLQPHRWPGA